MKTASGIALGTIFVVLATFAHAYVVPQTNSETSIAEPTETKIAESIPETPLQPTTQPELASESTTAPKPRMHNGKEYDDLFYKKFTNRDDVDETVELALSWDAEKQHDHFKQMQHHTNANDDYAEYAQQIIHAAQRLLDRSLKEANYTKKHIDVEDYVNAAYAMQKNHEIQDEDLKEVLHALYNCKGDAIERATDAGDERSEEYYLENMPSYQEVPV